MRLGEGWIELSEQLHSLSNIFLDARKISLPAATSSSSRRNLNVKVMHLDSLPTSWCCGLLHLKGKFLRVDVKRHFSVTLQLHSSVRLPCGDHATQSHFQVSLTHPDHPA